MSSGRKELALTSKKRENGAMKIPSLKQAIAQMVMPRIEGNRLSEPAYRDAMTVLVREGLGGFILFGGDIESTPRYLAELQSRAEFPLLISSDVERGLGQQLEGGTRFPVACRIALVRCSKRTWTFSADARRSGWKPGCRHPIVFSGHGREQ
jgi:beta-glucosidase-like glycosyl hydrolase